MEQLRYKFDYDFITIYIISEQLVRQHISITALYSTIYEVKTDSEALAYEKSLESDYVSNDTPPLLVVQINDVI